MRLLSNLHVKGKPAVLPDRAIRSQSHYFIYRPCTVGLQPCWVSEVDNLLRHGNCVFDL